MKRSEAAERRVEDYLRAVERQLAGKPASARQEVVAGLRDHIAESLRRVSAEGGEIGLEVVERILAEMDPPETFAEAAAEAATEAVVLAAPAARRGGAGRWFVLGVAFLLLNAYGIWKWTSAPRLPPPPAGIPAVVDAPPERPAEKVLRLRKVEQVDVSPEREVVLVLLFSEMPEREQLARHFHLTAEGQGEVEYRLAGAMGSNTVMLETAPVLAEKLEYRLDPGLPSASDAKPTDRPEKGALAMDMNMALKEIRAESPSFEKPVLEARFNAFPDMNGAQDHVSVEPAVEFTVEAVDYWRWKGLSLRGDFKPGHIYEVTFQKGLPAANGSSLPQTVKRSVQFPLPAPAIQLDGPGRYLAPGGALSVPVQAANLKEYVAGLRPVFENNLVELARRESEYHYDLTEDLTASRRAVTNALPASTNGAPVRSTVDLRALAGGEPRGVYWLDVGGKNASGDGRLLVVTDLGVAARVFRGGALVWVNSLRDAAPVEGAAVAVFARNNQVLARGKTDARGLAELKLPEGEGTDPFMVTAEREGDLSYMALSRTRVEQGEGLGGEAYLEAGQVEAAVFTDRGVYRPGETVFIQAIARDDQLRAPEPFPALVRVRRPDGRIFRDIPVELDGYGSARTEAKLPEYLPTGRYGLELALPGTFTVLGRTSVALEDFVPPQIRVSVEPPEGRRQAGDVLGFRVKGEHLFGRAASGLKVSAAATFKAVPFTPAQWPGWRFGDEEKAFSPVYRTLGTTALDGEGRAEFEAESQRAWRPPAALQMVQQGTVMEASGRSVTAYATSMLDPYPFYVGLKPAWEGAVRAGETQRMAVVEVLPDGSPMATNQPLVLTLSRVTWNSVLRRNSDGRYEWKSERQVVEIRQDTLAADGEATEWAFAVDGPGEYTLAAADPDSGASSRIFFYAGSADSEWLAWSREKPGRVELAWDQERYAPGETARLQVRAPFAGRALLTVETDRVREVRVVELDKNTAEIEVAVERGHAPNAYCTLTLIRPARPEAVWSAHRAIGAIALPVEVPASRLQVAIAAPADARPQTKLAGTVAVRGEDGNPARGAVTVMAVDEAICMLTAFETPDPATVFAAQRALGVDAYDLYAELMPLTEEQMEGTPAPGGDGEDVLRKRLNPIKANRFKPVALWQAALELDADGRAAFEMELPEFSGELRLMAVAYNAAQTGSTSTPVKVKRDLVVQPSLPRFLAIGDACEASVSLHNTGGQPMAATVRATCGGPLRADVAEQRIEIPAGGSARVALPLVAGPGPGKALCTIEVEAGADSYRETIELAVRPAAGSRVAVTSRVLKAGESATLDPPADWLPASRSASVSLSATPSLQMGRALDYVVHYPYGCLEQTVSGAFPLLHAGEWAGRLLPSGRAIGETEAWVKSAISRVGSMQQENGGFALWPFARGVEEDASLYAVHFLVEARAAGFDVPADRLALALDWVRGRLDRPVPADASESDWILAMQGRAYMCHILALAGRPDSGWNSRLREQSARLNFAARAHAASALLLEGEPRRALPLMESMALPATRARVPGRLLDSDVRDAALLLGAWLEVDPENEAVSKLAQFLRDRQRDGHWGNTQDDALALLAFGKLARQLPDEEQPFAGSLTLPDGSVREFPSTNDVQASLAPGEGGSVTVRNDGPGKLYLLVRHEGVSSVPEAASEQGVSIQREYLDIGGAPIDPADRPQGDLIVVRLTVDAKGRLLDQLVIEDLLPAGWEIENPNLATSEQFGWLRQREESDRHRDARDDRMLIFTGAFREKASFHYAVRAVTPGVYALPPATVSGMYEPEIRGVAAGGTVRVVP